MRRFLIANIAFLFSTILVCQETTFGADNLSVKLDIQIRTVYLDPWYGGKESGPRFTQGKLGKDVTLEIARKMQHLLETNGFNVRLSRLEDKFVTPDERVSQARAQGSDLYIIIKVSEARKSCIGIYTEPFRSTNNKHSARMKKSNDPGYDLNQILDALSTDMKHAESLTLAGTIAKKLTEEDSYDCIQILRSFDYVLLEAPMPAVAVDFSVSSSSKKQPYIFDAAYQNTVAQSLFNAIQAYAVDRAPKKN